MKTFALILLGISGFLILSVAVAQDTESRDTCAVCTITHRTAAVAHVDKTVCPGENAIVCDYYWEQNTNATCSPPGGAAAVQMLDNCRSAQKVIKYPTTKFPAGTCGVDNPLTDTMNCGATPPGPPGPMVSRNSALCLGDSWSGEVIPVLALSAPLTLMMDDGPMRLEEGATVSVAGGEVQIPASVLKAAGDQIKAVDGNILLTLQLFPEEPARFTFPQQDFRPRTVDDHLQIRSASVKGGMVTWVIAVPKGALGAYEHYSVGLDGLKMTAPAGVKQLVMPLAGAEHQPAAFNPADLTVLMEISSGTDMLTSGAGKLGKLNRTRPVAASSKKD